MVSNSFNIFSLTERITFHDLSPTPHKERGKQRKRTIRDPLLTGQDNLKIVEEAHKKCLKKEELEKEKTKVVKEYVRNRGRGRGRGGKRGSVDNPKL